MADQLQLWEAGPVRRGAMTAADRSARWRARHPDESREEARRRRARDRAKNQDRRLYKMYRMTRFDRDRRLFDQNHLCGICYRALPLVIDHDHACCPGDRSCGRCVRGLLCRDCNVWLGYLELMEIDQQWIPRAMSYRARYAIERFG